MPGLADVDPCHLLTDDELIASGASVPGRPQRRHLLGAECDFDGDPFGCSVFKNQRGGAGERVHALTPADAREVRSRVEALVESVR